MFIKKIIEQNRRDFRADYECQFCGELLKNKSGYDDEYFHNSVIPDMKCPKCGKSTNSENDTNYRPLTTKYPEGFEI